MIVEIIHGFFAALFQVANALTWLLFIGIIATIAYYCFYLGF